MLKPLYKDSLIESINVFCENINCSNCGGTYNYHTFTCEYCDTYNEELKESFEKITSIISSLNKDDIDKELCLSLYKLSKINNIFSQVLGQFNLDEDVGTIIKELEKNSEYSNEDVKLLDFIFSNDVFLEKDNVLRDLILRNVILRKNSLSKELIEKVISHLVLVDIRKISKDSKFYIRNLGDKVLGSAFYYYVYLDRDVMDDFYDNGSIRIFYVLPHEMQHTYRTFLENKDMVNSIYDLMALKEKLLRAYNQDIYCNEKKYVKNLHEIEANTVSYYRGTEYLKSLGFEVSEESALNLSNIINNDLTRLDNPLREIERELVNINDLFFDFIKDKIDLLYKYPQLQYEFKEENGSVVYKSKNELVDDMLFRNTDINIEELFLALINNAYNREKVKKDDNTLRV